MRNTVLLSIVLLVLLSASPAPAKIIYVDNHIGDDVNSGTAPIISGLRTGPIRTFRRALSLVGPGDVIEIANTGNPYHDSLRLIGGRCSGVPSQPLFVNGNGAIIDGSELVIPDAWEPLGGGLWRLEPAEKGWYQLVRDERPVPEVPIDDDAARPNPPPGRWAAWRGAIYYRGLPDEIPANEPYRIAAREAGVFLYGVHDVVVRDLTLRHFRLDGANAHDQVYRVVLQNVVSESNGRSGLFVGGSSEIVIRGGATQHNRQASLLLTEQSRANMRDVSLDEEPVVE